MNTKKLRHFHGWMTVVWIIMVPVSLAMGWLSSIVYVSAISVYALVLGHWSSWQAARAEERVEEET